MTLWGGQVSQELWVYMYMAVLTCHMKASFFFASFVGEYPLISGQTYRVYSRGFLTHLGSTTANYQVITKTGVSSPRVDEWQQDKYLSSCYLIPLLVREIFNG